MWDWLNTNAGAVQAGSAAVSAFIAWKLVALTCRYVDLTGILAESSKKQVEIAQLQAEATRNLEAASRRQQQLMDDANEQARRQLSGMSARYLSALAGLSTTTIAPSALLALPKLTAEELKAFDLASTQAKLKSSEDAETASSGLTWLAALQDRVASSSNAQFSFAETTMYTNTFRNLRNSLKKLTTFRPAFQEY